MAAWTTRGDFASAPYGQGSRVYVAPLGADLAPRERVGTLLDLGTAYGVSLVRGRDGYFAAWMRPDGMRVAIVDSFGRVMRSADLAIEGMVNDMPARAAWNGRSYLALGGSPEHLRAMILDESGVVVATQQVDGEPVSSGMIDVTGTADGFLLFAPGEWTLNGGSIHARRVAQDGSLGAWARIRGNPSNISALASASDGTRAVVAWSDAYGVWMADLDTQALLLGAPRQLSAEGLAGDVALVNGEAWVSYSLPGGDSFVVRIAADGSSTTSELGVGFSPVLAASQASVAAAYLAVPQGGTTFEFDVLGRVLAPARSPEVLLSRSETNQSEGVLAPGSTSTLAVWEEEIDHRRQVFFNRIAANGALLDDSGVQLTHEASNLTPVASPGNGVWLVAWLRVSEVSRQVVARRVREDGTLLDQADIVLGEAQYGSRIATAFDGTNWMVAWNSGFSGSSCGNIGAPSRLYATRISADGRVLDPPKVIPTLARMDQYDPQLAFDGQRYVLAWAGTCVQRYGGTTSAIAGAAIDRELGDIDVFALTGVLASSRASSPRVAAAPGQVLVAWQQATGTDASTFFRVLEGAPRSASRRRSIAPTVPGASVDGAIAALSWDPSRGFSVFSLATIPWATGYTGLFETPVSQRGEAGSPRFHIVVEPETRYFGSVVVTGSRRWIAERTFDGLAGAQRMWARVVD